MKGYIRSYLSIGTNIGNRLDNLLTVIGYINDINGINIEQISSIYNTKPYGYKQQSDFLNIVSRISTKLNPEDMLEKFQKIENDMGRIKCVHWGPRIIDIDILLYDNINVKKDNLVIPHIYMFKRAFVLIPLKEVYKNDSGYIEFNRIISECSDKKGVKFFRGSDFFEK